jgi:hypothetical protein
MVGEISVRVDERQLEKGGRGLGWAAAEAAGPWWLLGSAVFSCRSFIRFFSWAWLGLGGS